MQIKNLSPNPNNPRRVSDEKLKLLDKTLKEFGDLSGLVFNRRSKQLIAGHQRTKLFNKASEVVIERVYKTPTRTGTVREGFVEFEGERFNFREVDWDEFTEKAANIAANKGAGEFDSLKLGEWFTDLEDFGFDTDLTLFEDFEIDAILNPKKPKKKTVEFEVSDKTDDDEMHACPKCDFKFNG